MITLAFKRSWRVLAAYGAFTMWGLMCLVVSILLILGEEALPALASSVIMSLVGIVVATVGGHFLGNLVALLRLRLWVVFAIAGLVGVGLILSLAVVGPATGFLVIGALAAAGGYFGVASRMEIFAAWLPLTYAVGAAVLWMNTHGKVSVWLTGAKFAVWDAITFAFLSGAVFFFLVFLLTRHALALTLWQDAARPGSLTTSPDDIHARAGRGSFAVLFALTGVILVATAVLSPFLFRTEVVHGRGRGHGAATASSSSTRPSHAPTHSTAAPHPIAAPAPKPPDTCAPSADGSGTGVGCTPPAPVHADASTSPTPTPTATVPTPPQAPPTPTPVPTPPQVPPAPTHAAPPSPVADPPTAPSTTTEAPKETTDDVPAPDMERAAHDGVTAAKLGLSVVGWLVVFLALLTLLALFFRPARRMVLLRHLENPLWRTTPTGRIDNLWLRALIALDDLGVHLRSDESPEKLARRARDELHVKFGEVPGGVEAAAKIVERLEYAGRGLSPDEEKKMRAAVRSLLTYAATHASVWTKLTQAWATVRVR